MTVQVPANDTAVGVSVGYAGLYGGRHQPALLQRAAARVNLPPSLISISRRSPSFPNRAKTYPAPSVRFTRFVTFPPFYRAFVFVPPPDYGKVVKGYTGGDSLNRLKFIGRSGL